jgi:hypothetical protein
MDRIPLFVVVDDWLATYVLADTVKMENAIGKSEED